KLCYTTLQYNDEHTGVVHLNKTKLIPAILIIIIIILVISGINRMNEEEKANEILDYFDEIGSYEEDTQEKLDSVTSEGEDIVENQDIDGMAQIIEEDIIPAFEAQLEDLNQMELKYRATKKIRKRNIDLLEGFLSFNEWQLEVLKNESPQNELEEIMKPEIEGPFGSEIERDRDSEHVKYVTEIRKKKEYLETKKNHYWKLYHNDDYIEEE